jgi:hypothetical protein
MDPFNGQFFTHINSVLWPKKRAIAIKSPNLIWNFLQDAMKSKLSCLRGFILYGIIIVADWGAFFFGFFFSDR